jgi:mannose-6-phosphate isomerase-like protein (cupin superfamily)
MHLGDETRQVGPGDTILIEPGTWHDIEAEEGGRIVMLVTCAPAWHPGDQFFK